MEVQIKPLTKLDYECGELVRFVRPAEVAPRARLGVKWLALLRFADGSEGYFMVGTDARARELWPERNHG